MLRRKIKLLCRATVIGLSAAVPLAGMGQVYMGVQPASGAVVLSNFQSQDTPELLVAAPADSASAEPAAASPAALSATPRLPAAAGSFQNMINAVAATVDLAPRLIHAVISAESNYDPKAVSPRGAIGLMQLMPATARRFGVTDPFVVRDNVFAGASYLKWLMGFFGGDLELVLAAYNAGEQAVVKAGRKVPQYPETQAYVRRVMANLRKSEVLPS